MKIIISTTNRHVPPSEPSGYLFTYDFGTNSVIRKTRIVEAPYIEVNPNPRGGLRGLHGISRLGNNIGLVNSSTIFLYDHHWKPIVYFFHPICSAIHELAIAETGIFVTSTSNDLLCYFNYSGKLLSSINIRPPIKYINNHKNVIIQDNQPTRNEYSNINFRDPRTHDLVETDKAHINSVYAQNDGTLLISLGLLKNSNFSRLLGIKTKLTQMGIWKWFIEINAFLRKNVFKNVSESKGEMLIQAATGVSAIVKYDPKTKSMTPILHFSGSTVPSHSVRVLSDGTGIYLNSSAGELINFDLSDGHVIFTDKVGSKFLRGARQLSDGNLILGDGNHFILYDIQNRKVIERIKFTDETAPSVFDFCELPEDFDIPPVSLVELHEKFLPLDQINFSKLNV